MTNFRPVIEKITKNIKSVEDRGTVASYIPELAHIDKNKFGIFVTDTANNEYGKGDAEEGFSIQSISKALSLSQAFVILGDALWERVDVEPSGDPFNHLSLLEVENGIPRNPFINAGAIVVADVLVSYLNNPKSEFLSYVRNLANDNTIIYDEAVALSEENTGYNNIAAAYLLKSFGNIENDVDEVLDFYFYQCSLKMSCRQLTHAFYLFMNGGKCQQGRTYLTPSQTKRINAIMLTCGFYDEAGEFAFEVGLPGKSGVGGGIVAYLPNEFCAAIWSPGLNVKGNSKLGMQALEQLTTLTGLSIF
ncbi:MAG: glutaminase [Gammaproteobacteria bacterium]|jgi:glutaminase